MTHKFKNESSSSMNVSLPADRSSAQDRPELGEALNIAWSQLALRRRQLGVLTRDQEVAIENLVISTTAKIAGLIIEAQLVMADKLSAI